MKYSFYYKDLENEGVSFSYRNETTEWVRLQSQSEYITSKFGVLVNQILLQNYVLFTRTTALARNNRILCVESKNSR